jgi:hypothetical protein
VLLAPPGASAGKWCAPARSSVKLTAASGSGVLATGATVETLEELRKALAVIAHSLKAHHLPQEHVLLPSFGQDGTGAVLSDLAGLALVTRGKDYTLLDHPRVSARLHLPPDQVQQREDKPDATQPL